MKRITIFKRKANIALFAALAATFVAGCKKGTFDINNNPNVPTSIDPKYSLSYSLTATASLMYNGNEDILQNWMGYWTQSGAYTPSNTYVLYQMTSGTSTGNWDQAYPILNNYKGIITAANANASLANYKAIAMIMSSFIYQRIVDLYNKAPFSEALILNAQYSYKYDDGATIYKASIAKIDSALAIIKANPSAASVGNYDVMFKGNMAKWTKFGNTLKLKMLMRQTESTSNGSLGSAGVASALATNPNTGAPYVAADFLGLGEDAMINPGYSNAADNQINPLYIDVVENAVGGPGYNEKYFRANKFGVDFYNNHNDPRLGAFYLPNNNGVIQGRVYGSQNGNEANSIISGLTGYGYNAGYSEGAPIIPAAESLFLQAEAAQRGYLPSIGLSAQALYENGVKASFEMLGVPNADAAAATYVAQPDPLTNWTASSNKIDLIITQKWAALNSTDVLESYSDWRRTNYPDKLPVSIYPGNQQTHIPYRLPYPTTELNYNTANVPDGGTATQALTVGVFWMPNISR